jgi:hypothetical protein
VQDIKLVQVTKLTKVVDAKPDGLTKPNVVINQDELVKGIEIEYEHTRCKMIAKRIALDHLAEADNSTYYTYLDIVEKKIEDGIKPNESEV